MMKNAPTDILQDKLIVVFNCLHNILLYFVSIKVQCYQTGLSNK